MPGSTNSSGLSTAEDAGNATDPAPQVHAEDVPPAANSTSPLIQLSKITSEQWAKDMLPYKQPVHISLRASQMGNVAFPVDHKAILWCYDVSTRELISATELFIKSSDHF